METTTELEEALDEVSGHLNAQHALLVDAAIVMLDNPLWWSGPGVEQPHRYLAWRTAISLDRAKQIVSIAERAEELPVCLGRFRAGELSVDQMAAVAKRTPWWADEQVADLAAKLTVSQLRRTLGQYPFPVVPKPVDAGAIVDASDGEREGAESGEDASCDDCEGSHDCDGSDDGESTTGDAEIDRGTGEGAGPPDSGAARRPDEWMWFGWGDDGRFRLHLEVDADTGLLVEQALKESSDRLFAHLGEKGTLVDALRDVAERSLDQIDRQARRDRYRINLHLDTDGTCTDACGRALPDVIRRHIGCDGHLSPVFVQEGVPLAVGRTQHIVPLRLRRQVIRRDHGACRVPGCGADVFVEIHHVIHWEDHGVTESWNLICLCPQHHRMHHRGELGITGDADDPDGVTFTNRYGLVISASGAKPKPPGAPPRPPSGRYRHPLGERLESRWIEFTPPPTPQPAS